MFGFGKVRGESSAIRLRLEAMEAELGKLSRLRLHVEAVEEQLVAFMRRTQARERARGEQGGRPAVPGSGDNLGGAPPKFEGLRPVSVSAARAGVRNGVHPVLPEQDEPGGR